ncbi:MAG TPA: hypothetical protein VMY41_13225 [Thermohalobaculum sp.]|nr:hypothetical protein [Thermohalobaculum sp.]
MSEVTSDVAEAASTSGAFEAFSRLDGGFLGTGYSSSAELSLLAVVLFAFYVVFGTIRYRWPEFSFLRLISRVLGLDDSRPGESDYRPMKGK